MLAVTAIPLGPLHGGRLRRPGPTARRPATASSRPIERVLYRLLRVDPRREQRWNVYAIALLAFSLVSFLVVYALQRFQGSLPFNPTNMPAVAPLGAFNAAVSFMTNTNWQWYSGELTMSHLTQMVGLAVQNFVSAAAGMAVVVAIIRGISRRGRRTLGNFWVDLTRTTLRILLPLSFVVAILLSLGGVVQNFRGLTEATPVDAAVAAEATPVDPRRAGGQPDRHQAARHERRRVLQHQLGAPVREPERRSPTSSRRGRSSSSRSPSSSPTAS